MQDLVLRQVARVALTFTAGKSCNCFLAYGTCGVHVPPCADSKDDSRKKTDVRTTDVTTQTSDVGVQAEMSAVSEM